MYLLTKEADELYVIASPDEKLRIGDTLDIDGVLAQIIEVRFADLPGVLEHILRKALIPKSDVEEHIQPEVKSIVDSLSDQRLAIAKIRGRIETDGSKRFFKTGIMEFSLSRSKAEIRIMDPSNLFDLLRLEISNDSDFARVLSSSPSKFDIAPQNLGINLITGMKESGKSYFAKRLLLRLIEKGVVTLVFDLNGEYLHLWKDKEGKPNDYASVIKVMTPHLSAAKSNEVPFFIPLNEITYTDFANFVGVTPGIPMYNVLIQFWESRGENQFDLNDLERYVTDPLNVENEAVRIGLRNRVRTARSLNLFGPSNLTDMIHGLQKSGGGAVIINLATTNHWERKIVVEFVLNRLSRLGLKGEIKPLSLFLEEAQLYVTPDNVVNILTRMRHVGIYPTFVTNDPRTLPDEVFSLCDNVVAFMFHNEDDLKQIAKARMMDMNTVGILRNLENRQCMAIGRITSNYPIFIEIMNQEGVMMAGETKKLV